MTTDRTYSDRIKEICQQDPPLVVVRCLAYNHEPYILDCLDGFIMQKTDFRFVVIIHDDASTDNTAKIISEYANKYPDKIISILQKENLYSKHQGLIGQIICKACKDTGAKYIAMCEGDDYWTDPLKLQKQVDFMEANPEFYLCFHNTLVKYENNKGQSHPIAEIETREYSAIELFENYISHTSSLLFKKGLFEDNRYQRILSHKIISGDVAMITTAATLGKVHGMTDMMSVYRRNNSGISNNFLLDETLTLRSRLVIGKILKGKIGQYALSRAKLYSKYFFKYVFTSQLGKAQRVGKVLWEYNPLVFLYGLMQTLLYPFTLVVRKFPHKNSQQ